MSGGVKARARREFIHGYVWCNAALDGSVAHSCRHGEGPHRIKVCVVKKDNTLSVFARLTQLAGHSTALSSYMAWDQIGYCFNSTKYFATISMRLYKHGKLESTYNARDRISKGGSQACI